MFEEKEQEKRVIKIVIGYFIFIPLSVLAVALIIFAIGVRLPHRTATYYTNYKYGNEITKGTAVTLNGIDVGKVNRVELDDDNTIKVELAIRKKYVSKIREDSVAKIIRPLLIGNKEIFITAGSPEFAELPRGSKIKSQESSELIDLVSGLNVNDFLMSLNLTEEGLSQGELGQLSIKELYDQAIASLVMMGQFQEILVGLSESMEGMNTSMGGLSEGMTNLDQLAKTMEMVSVSMDSMEGLAGSLENMTESLSAMEDLSTSMTSLSDDLDSMAGAMEELASLSTEMERMNTSLEGLGDMGEMMGKLTLFIEEMDTVVRALQESILLKSKVEKVRKIKEQEQEK